MRRPGANFGLFQCPQGDLDPDNGTELRTRETKLAKEDKEGDGPTMGPDFQAAELPSQPQFHIFPVSLRIWAVGGWELLGSPAWSCLPHFLLCFLVILPRMPSHHPTVVNKY